MLAFAARELKRKANAEHDRQKARHLRQELERVERLKGHFDGVSPVGLVYRGSDLAKTGQKLGERLAELHARPSVPFCDVMVRELAEAMRAVHRLRRELQGGDA